MLGDTILGLLNTYTRLPKDLQRLVVEYCGPQGLVAYVGRPFKSDYDKVSGAIGKANNDRRSVVRWKCLIHKCGKSRMPHDIKVDGEVIKVMKFRCGVIVVYRKEARDSSSFYKSYNHYFDYYPSLYSSDHKSIARELTSDGHNYAKIVKDVYVVGSDASILVAHPWSDSLYLYNFKSKRWISHTKPPTSTQYCTPLVGDGCVYFANKYTRKAIGFDGTKWLSTTAIHPPIQQIIHWTGSFEDNICYEVGFKHKLDRKIRCASVTTGDVWICKLKSYRIACAMSDCVLAYNGYHQAKLYNPITDRSMDLGFDFAPQGASGTNHNIVCFD